MLNTALQCRHSGEEGLPRMQEVPQSSGTNNAAPPRLSWKSPEPVSSHIWKTHPILSSQCLFLESAPLAEDTKPRCPAEGARQWRQKPRQAGAARKDEKRRSVPQAKHVPKAQIANGAWDLCPQVQMSQMCQVLETAPQVAGTRSSLWRTVCYYPVLLLQPLPAACPPFESGLRSRWCCSLGRASCSSPICFSFGLQRPRKTKLYGKEEARLERAHKGHTYQGSLPLTL